MASAAGNQVHLWDPATGKAIKTLLNIGKTEKPLKAIAFSPDGKFLAVAGDDGILRVIESDTGKEKYKSPSRNARLERVAWSPNGNMVVVGDGNQQVAVYAPNLPNQLAMAVQGVDLGSVVGVAFTADNKEVLTCGGDGKIHLTWGPKPDGTSAGNTATRDGEFVGHIGAATALALVPPDGKYFVSGGVDKSVRVWDLASKKQMRSFHGHLTRVTAVAARGDGGQIASSSKDGAIRIWDLRATDAHRTLTDATDSLWAVAFSPDGKRVAAAGSDRMIRIYDPETGKLEATLNGAKSPITSLAFFPDSTGSLRRAAIKVVVVWDVGKQKVLKEFSGHSPRCSRWRFRTMEADRFGRRGGRPDVRGVRPDEDKPAWVYTARSAVCAVAIRKGGRPGGRRAGGWLARHARCLGREADGARADRSCRGRRVPRLQPRWQPAGERRRGWHLARLVGGWERRLSPLARFEGQAKPGSQRHRDVLSPDRRRVLAGRPLRRGGGGRCRRPRLGRGDQERSSRACAAIPTGSRPSRSVRTAVPSPRSASKRTRPSASSNCRRWSLRDGGTCARVSMPSRSAPMGRPPPRRRSTRRSSSGTSPPANRWARWSGTPISHSPWRS